jgi:glucose/arabinose dehydrogenase
LLLPGAARGGVPEAGFTETLVASGLAQPTAIAPLPDGRLLVSQRAGQVLLASGGLEVSWVANQMGAELGLISGTATLVRKLD